MDTIQHAVAGGVMAMLITTNLYIIILCMILGALPDIIGWLEKAIYNDPTSWNWYEKAHYKWKLLFVIPPYGLHILLDRFTHGEGKRWWKLRERLWAEVLVWLILFIIILCLH